MDFEARLATADGRELVLNGTHVIGRGQDCDLTLVDTEASRRHAQLSVEDQRVFAEDLGSSNGTRINGAPLTVRAELRAGDILEIGTTRLTLTINGEGAADAGDATMIAADATVLAAAGVEAGAALPGAWTDDESSEKTQFLPSTGNAAANAQVSRQSEAAHLVIVDATGAIADVLELTREEGETVWEIGRDPGCDIQLNDPTVSGRHAQLIHKEGRWRAVNLISSNGLVVNGEKRLSVYLSDGDRISLGTLGVIFFADAGSAKEQTSGSGKRNTRPEKGTSSSGNALKWALVVVLLVAIAGGAAWYLLR